MDKSVVINMVKASLAVAVRTLSEILEMKSRTFTFFLSDESFGFFIS